MKATSVLAEPITATTTRGTRSKEVRSDRQGQIERLFEKTRRWILEDRFGLSHDASNGLVLTLNAEDAYKPIIRKIRIKKNPIIVDVMAEYERMLAKALNDVEPACVTLADQIGVLDSKDKDIRKTLVEAIGESIDASSLISSAYRKASYDLPGPANEIVIEARRLTKFWADAAKSDNKSLTDTWTIRNEMLLYRALNRRGVDDFDAESQDVSDLAPQIATDLGMHDDVVLMRLKSFRRHLPLAAATNYALVSDTDSVQPSTDSEAEANKASGGVASASSAAASDSSRTTTDGGVGSCDAMSDVEIIYEKCDENLDGSDED